MFAKTDIQKLINDAEEAYCRCWDILCSLKKPTFTRETPDGIVNFQIILTEAILPLERQYRAIAGEKKQLIRKKSELSEMWFKRRMKALSAYQEVLNATISLGKSLGDIYAWFFYQKECDYLLEHLKHADDLHVPLGIGGAGELTFLRNNPGLDGHITLYHGITNILRLGDVSFIKLSTLELTAIGELKTQQSDERRLEISMNLIGPKLFENFSFWDDLKRGDPPQNNFSESRKARHKRQLEGIYQSFENIYKLSKDKYFNLYSQSHLRELHDVVRRGNRSSPAYQKAGDGLLLVAYKHKRRKLLSKLLEDDDVDAYLGKDTRMVAEIQKISDMSSSNNSLRLGTFHYGAGLKSHILAGMIPLFWLSNDLEVLRQIYFQDILVITMYNPVHLIKKLTTLGFEVMPDAHHKKYTIVKKFEDRKAELLHFEFFLRLVENGLYNEQMIVDTFKTALDIAMNHKIQEPIEIELRMLQMIMEKA